MGWLHDEIQEEVGSEIIASTSSGKFALVGTFPAAIFKSGSVPHIAVSFVFSAILAVCVFRLFRSGCCSFRAISYSGGQPLCESAANTYSVKHDRIPME